ncbi:MAG TPA: pantetheine-phosphate adenylyltransferase, partial [Armatimonadota bacterium]|nr:pantetheine-phosphate adenylyltransferase [Armatimonadota bacterium]
AGLVTDAARAVGADCLARGVRDADDYARETRMALANRALTGIETLLVPASPGLAFISASLVKDIAAFGGDISPFVPAVVAEHLLARLAR